MAYENRKKALFSKIDVENPPSRAEINEWKDIISKGINEDNDEELLTDVAVKLALLENPETDTETLKNSISSFKILKKRLEL